MRPFVAFDTSTDHLALAVGDLDDPGAVLGASDFPAPRRANTALLAAVEHLLDSAGLTPADLAAVAVGRGPGSFTGVRIGVATAKGLAHSLRRPLVGFGTLDAIARRNPVEGLVGVLGDAMRGEVYPALFRMHSGGLRRETEDRVALPARVACEWASLGEPVTLAGGALVKHRAVFQAALGERARFAPAARWTPDGRSLIAAAWAEQGDLAVLALSALSPGAALAQGAPGRLLPVYTRLSDAEEAERLRLGREDAVPRSGVSVAPPGADRVPSPGDANSLRESAGAASADGAGEGR